MRTLEENVELLSRAIISDAEDDAKHIIIEAKAQAAAILQRAQLQAEAEKSHVLEQASQDAERIRNQTLATAQLKSKTMILEHREMMLNQVFDGAHKQLPTVQQWSNYQIFAVNLLKEALLQFDQKKVILLLDDFTRKIITDKIIQDLSKELKIIINLGEPLKKNKGIFIETADGHLNYDNTFETRLSRLQSSLRSPVYHLLIGETL
jgi:V/A-type H+/Na+-transporting ATPase subunit E